MGGCRGARRLDTAGGTPIGFANPLLYTAAGAQYASDFTDVTSGTNDYTPDGYNGGLYPAGPGYDMATGLGTPLGALRWAGLSAARRMQ